MKRFILPVWCLIAACNPEAAGEPVARIDLDNPNRATDPSSSPVVATTTDCRPATFEGVTFTDCQADPARHRITTMLGNPPFRGFAALAAARGSQAPKVAFAVNAGMFDDAGKPIGYYVRAGERGKELNRNEGAGNFHMQPNGVFFGSGGKWQVMAASDFYTKIGDRPEFGTQSGPMLLVGGKLHPEITDDGPSRTIRNGVGVDGAGRAHFVISEGPVSFGKLARYYRDVLKVRDALYLDGAVSSLWDPAAKRMDARAPIGPMLLIEEKRP
jgi:uncharacterized protein YigE (DUF2233 family)